MIIEETPIPGVQILSNKRYGDSRGWFSEVFRKQEFEEAVGHSVTFVQTNESFSEHNILRGIHFQNPHPQGKLVRVVEGEVFDVAVDLRKSSQTFGQWYGITLSADNGKQLWVPEGFGHGFYVTGTKAHFVYECTDYYHPESEKTILYNDPYIGIEWPLKDNNPPLTSTKDLQGSHFNSVHLFD